MSKQPPIVLQLQALAIEGTTGVPELLRRAMLISTKLDLREFNAWVRHELHGYGGSEEALPDYRNLVGVIKALNPYHGHVPVQFQDTQLEEMLREVPVSSSIDHIEALLGGDGQLVYPLHPRQQAAVRPLLPTPMEITRFVDRSQLLNVISTVRNMVLQWSLDLEAAGVLGEGLTFTEAEKRKASMASSINIQNFQGVLGDVSESTVHQHLSMSFAPKDMDGLLAHLSANGVAAKDLTGLRSALSEDAPTPTAGKFGEHVSAWIAGMMGKAAAGTWSVGLAAAGNLLSGAISRYYGLPTG
jgi:hypothetical protein